MKYTYIGRLATGEDVAQAALFLASEEENRNAYEEEFVNSVLRNWMI